jgi:pimeloyl-ACP methyl ester carboxylesterase
MRYFNSDGVSIAYIDVPPHHEGPGDPILLIHGFASSHAVNWANTLWVKTLTRAGYRVIAHDNRGHGESEKLYDPRPTTPSSWRMMRAASWTISGSSGPT